MITPTDRLIGLAAAGAPVALVIGVLVPGLWLLPLGWVAALLVLALYDLAVMPGALAGEIRVPGAVNVGEAFAVRVAVRGDGAPRRVEAALAFDARLAAADGGTTAVVFAGGAGAADMPVTALRRGLAAIGALTLRWQGPLGLVWRQRREMGVRSLLVTPDVRPVHRESIGLLARDAATGLMAQMQAGAGGEFEALGDFQPGMDRRRIDWKQSARHVRLVAREYRAERDNHIVLAFDCGRTMCEPVDGVARLDRAIAAGLLTAYVALKLGDRVSLFGFDARPRVAGAALAGVGAFAGLQRLAGQLDYSADETNHTLALSALAARLQRRSLILLFTEFVDTVSAELMLRSAGRLLERHVLLCVVMRDAELETLVATRPETPEDMSRAVVAGDLLRERRIVLERLRRMGVEVLEAPWQVIGPDLARRYMAAKQRGQI